MDSIQWHRACELLHLPEQRRREGWPGALNIEQIARLHFHNDKAMERALLSFLKAAVETGEAAQSGTDKVCRYAAAVGGTVAQVCASLPVLSRAAYAALPSRPPLPDGSPLAGWIGDPTQPSESDASLGRARRAELQSFAGRNEERTGEREPEWERWRSEGVRIQAGRTRKASARELAELVKKALSLPDSVETIRRKL